MTLVLACEKCVLRTSKVRIAPGAADPVPAAMGNISFSITDGPREDTRAMVLHVTGMELGHSNGDDDYPADPDDRFDFQMFSDPMDVVAGQMGGRDMRP